MLSNVFNSLVPAKFRNFSVRLATHLHRRKIAKSADFLFETGFIDKQGKDMLYRKYVSR